MAAIGRMVIRGNENFVLIRPKGEALVLETLFLAEDVRSQAEIDEAVEAVDVKEPEHELARQLIDSLVGEWEPEALHSEYRQNLRKLLEAKLAGEEIAVPEPVADAPVVDLMEALKKSVAASKKRDGDKPAARKKAAPRKRAAATRSPRSGSRSQAPTVVPSTRRRRSRSSAGTKPQGRRARDLRARLGSSAALPPTTSANCRASGSRPAFYGRSGSRRITAWPSQAVA